MATVLIAEDDNDLQALYGVVLNQRGHTIITARSAAQVMKLLEEDLVPDIVFLDIGMPDAPGTRVIEHMRSEPRYDNTKIIVITAQDQYRDRIEPGDVSYFLVKPVAIAHINEIMEKLTG